MDLETFIAKSLDGIIAGIRKAQGGQAVCLGSDLADRQRPGVLNPPVNRTPADAVRLISGNGEPVYEVAFDIAVTVSENAGMQSGIKVLGLSVGGQTQATQSTASRIQFRIPVEWPR